MKVHPSLQLMYIMLIMGGERLLVAMHVDMSPYYVSMCIVAQSNSESDVVHCLIALQ